MGNLAGRLEGRDVEMPHHATKAVLVSGVALAGLLAWPTAGTAAGEVAPSAEQIRPLLIGASVPEVSVQSMTGEEIDLAAAVRSQPTVLIFYRGGW